MSSEQGGLDQVGESTQPAQSSQPSQSSDETPAAREKQETHNVREQVETHEPQVKPETPHESREMQQTREMQEAQQVPPAQQPQDAPESQQARQTQDASPQVAASLPAGPAATARPSARQINLKILSPAFELTGGLQLGLVAIDTTIGALKRRISDVAPGHPPRETQRLIYHGRMLPNDAQTLADVFGAAAIQQDANFTLHLVVRPLNAAVTPNYTTPTAQSRAQTPFSAAIPPRVTGTPTNATTATAPSNDGNNPASQFPQQPGVPHPHQAFLDAARQQVPGLPGHMFPQIPGFPAFAQPQFGLNHHHHFPPNVQQAPPPAAGQQPATSPSPAQALSAQPSPQPHPAASPPTPLTSGSTTRTINGPNGARYTVRVNHSTLAIHPPGHLPQPGQNPLHQNHFANIQHHFHPNQMLINPLQHHQLANMNLAQPAQGNAGGDVNVTEAFDDPVTAGDVRDLADLTSQFAQLMQNEPGISEEARQAARTLQTNTTAISSRLRDRSAGIAPALPLRAQSQQTQAQTGAAHVQHVQQFDATAATVYLLSSPAGPHAVLFAPQGTYAGHPQPNYNVNPMAHVFGGHPGQPAFRNTLPPPSTQFAAPGTNQPAHQHGLPDAPQNPPAHLAADGVPAQPAQQLDDLQNIVRQMNQLQQPNDVLAAWQPLLAQFWLLFRVMIFAYFFFPTDQSWYRPAALAFVCLAFWLLNGEGFGRQIRDAVRGWWEGVVGLPAQGVAAPPAQQDANLPNQPVVPAPPRPAEQQQQPQELHWLRQTLRPLERALALFLASLWPGIGERTVAARRAEEERQRREEQEEAQRQEATTSEAAHPVSGEGEQGDSAALGTQQDTSVSTENAASATLATGTDVGGGDELRERKPAPRPATVEEDTETSPGLVNQMATDW